MLGTPKKGREVRREEFSSLLGHMPRKACRNGECYSLMILPMLLLLLQLELLLSL